MRHDLCAVLSVCPRAMSHKTVKRRMSSADVHLFDYTRRFALLRQLNLVVRSQGDDVNLTVFMQS